MGEQRETEGGGGGVRESLPGLTPFSLPTAPLRCPTQLNMTGSFSFRLLSFSIFFLSFRECIGRDIDSSSSEGM